LLCNGRFCLFRQGLATAFGLQPAEVGRTFVQQAMGLGAGAVDGLLDSFGGGVQGFHGVEDVILSIAEAEDEVGFDFAAPAETPHGAADFVDERFFEDTNRGEILEQRLVECGVGGLFVGADEIARVEAEDYGVFRRCGFTRLGAGTGGGLSVRLVGCDLCGCGHCGVFLSVVAAPARGPGVVRTDDAALQLEESTKKNGFCDGGL